MVQGKTKIVNPMGMHARAAAQFISYVNNFNCSISIVNGNRVANAKSILNIIMMSLGQGTEITVKVTGEDEQNVLDEIITYIENMKE